MTPVSSLLVESSTGAWIRANVPGGPWGALLIAALVVPIALSFVLIRGSAAERQIAGQERVAVARSEGIPNAWRAAGYSRSAFVMSMFFIIVLVGSFFIK